MSAPDIETFAGNGPQRVAAAHARRAYPPFMHGPARMACADAGDPDVFTETGSTKAARRRIEVAKAVCGICPLRATCREWAIETEQTGVWGGTTTAERERIRQYREGGGRGCLH